MAVPTSPRYSIPATTCRCEIEVKRSRFIATIEPTTTTAEALAFVAQIKAEFPDASHNCWAYLIGKPGSTDRIGLSDDGEPHGVAGKPMLTTIQHSDIGDLTVVVSRYFGGTKLGKGGMVKAYTLAVKTALEQLEIGEKIDWKTLTLSTDYHFLDPLERLFPTFETQIIDKQFGEQITLQLKLPAEKLSELCLAITDLSAGKIAFTHK